MKNKLLINKCEEFYKKAAFIDVPPVMFEEIKNFTEYSYASRVLANINKNDIELKKTVMQYSNNPNNNLDDLERIFDIKLDGWKYLNLPQMKNIDLEIYFPHKLVLILKFNYNLGSPFGLFSTKEYNDKIIINLPRIINLDISSFDHCINNINTTIIHELTHFVQHNLSRMVDAEKNFGRPPKKYRSKLNYNEQHYNLPHEQRDVEFYTNLKDSFSLFKRWINSMPDVKNDIFNAWIGKSNLLKENMQKTNYSETIINKITAIFNNPQFPFKILKETNDPKYNLAVKIFWKEFQKLPA